jgi:hypothetical protein
MFALLALLYAELAVLNAKLATLSIAISKLANVSCFVVKMPLCLMEIREEFDKRIIEINLYFEILKTIELDKPKIVAFERNVSLDKFYS